MCSFLLRTFVRSDRLPQWGKMSHYRWQSWAPVWLFASLAQLRNLMRSRYEQKFVPGMVSVLLHQPLFSANAESRSAPPGRGPPSVLRGSTALRWRCKNRTSGGGVRSDVRSDEGGAIVPTRTQKLSYSPRCVKNLTMDFLFDIRCSLSCPSAAPQSCAPMASAESPSAGSASGSMRGTGAGIRCH